MNGKAEFFKTEVEFFSMGSDSIVSAEHPDLAGATWTLKKVAGWIGGLCLMVSVSYATHAKVTPLEAAALELRQAKDVEHVATQNLGGLMAEAREAIAKLRRGEPTGGPGLRARTANSFGPDAAVATATDEQTMAATARFIVRNS